MHRMFAAALLAVTMVGGAALAPSGASAAIAPGPNAIPNEDVVRSVDPEVAAIELVRRGGGGGRSFGGGGGSLGGRGLGGSRMVLGGGRGLGSSGVSRATLGGRYLDGGRRLAFNGRRDFDGGRRLAYRGRDFDDGRRLVYRDRRFDDDDFRFRRFGWWGVGAPYYSGYSSLGYTSLYDGCPWGYRRVLWNDRVVCAPYNTYTYGYPGTYGYSGVSRVTVGGRYLDGGRRLAYRGRDFDDGRRLIYRRR